MQHRQVHRWTLTVAATLRAKQSGCPVEKLRLPLSDLIGVNVELLSQLGQRLLAPDGGQSHLRLESRCVVPARSSGHCFSCAARILAAFRQKLHLSRCSDFLSQLWTRQNRTFYQDAFLNNRQFLGLLAGNKPDCPGYFATYLLDICHRDHLIVKAIGQLSSGKCLGHSLCLSAREGLEF